jgi:hypothetical protein
MGGTAYCDGENGGDASNESDEDPFNKVETGVFAFMLGASKMVSIGTMQDVFPTFGSVHTGSER